MQEFPQAKAANDAAVDKKQDIGDSKLNSDPDKQIGVGHVDGHVDGHVVEPAATGRYTAAKLHVPTLHACINRVCMHMLCRDSRVVTESASRFKAVCTPRTATKLDNRQQGMCQLQNIAGLGKMLSDICLTL